MASEAMASEANWCPKGLRKDVKLDWKATDFIFLTNSTIYLKAIHSILFYFLSFLKVYFC